MDKKITANNEHNDDQMLTLRDRVLKVETVIEYHDKEFQQVKRSISELTKTVNRNQDQILTKLDKYNKVYMDLMYDSMKEHADHNAAIVASIQVNKNNFNSHVSKWKAITWAVWVTISITLGAVGWGLSAAQQLGFFETRTMLSQEANNPTTITAADSDNPRRPQLN